MVNGAEIRGYGRVFNEIADEYDRHRPAYPDALVDRVCELAGLAAGARVLEIGCGTGQLTRSLLARGLRVTAVEPGEQLVARARARPARAGEVRFVNAPLEEAPLPRADCRAVFSASAIHWVDPDVSWLKIADALVDGGTIALLSFFGLQDVRSDEDQQALRAGLANVAPELASEWPAYRNLDATLTGVAQRRDNVSEAWAWLGNLIAENHALHQRLNRPIRSSTIACLVTARRRAPSASLHLRPCSSIGPYERLLRSVPTNG